MRVEVVQYMRPNGRKKLIWLDDVPEQYAPILNEISAAKCTLTAEHLTTGEVSFAIEHEEGDVSVEVCKNGPGTREAFYSLLNSFHSDWEKFRTLLAEDQS